MCANTKLSQQRGSPHQHVPVLCQGGYTREANCFAAQARAEVQRWPQDAESFSKVPIAKKLWPRALRAVRDPAPARGGNETRPSLTTCWPDQTQNGALRKQMRELHGQEGNPDLS